MPGMMIMVTFFSIWADVPSLLAACNADVTSIDGYCAKHERIRKPQYMESAQTLNLNHFPHKNSSIMRNNGGKHSGRQPLLAIMDSVVMYLSMALETVDAMPLLMRGSLPHIIAPTETNPTQWPLQCRRRRRRKNTYIFAMNRGRIPRLWSTL